MNEEKEQIQLCQYIKNTYEDVIFTSDQSGIRVGQGLAMKLKKLHSENGIPDLTIYESRGGYNALCIELKATGNSPFRKTGMLRYDEHLRKQWKMLLRLEIKGYCTGFCVGYQQAVEFVDWYMSLPANI